MGTPWRKTTALNPPAADDVPIGGRTVEVAAERRIGEVAAERRMGPLWGKIGSQPIVE